ncbi:aldo/keto reductase [Streptomyces sp. 061-3]|uniref:aldo/keto reductase n=1 Tax=Streptomyces sp. 061-3 TaxID=2789268 RepID=UPI003980FC30
MTKDEPAEAITHIAFYAGWPSAMGAVMQPKGIVETETGSGPGVEQQGEARWRVCRGAGPDGGPERTWGEHVTDDEYHARPAERAGITPAQVVLAWVVAQGEHVIPIPGTKTPKYLTDNAGAGDVELSPADLADLDALPAPEGGRY